MNTTSTAECPLMSEQAIKKAIERAQSVTNNAVSEVNRPQSVGLCVTRHLAVLLSVKRARPALRSTPCLMD